MAPVEQGPGEYGRLGMDPRDRADALLSRARARGGFVVTPDNMTSPMDAANTQQIPRSVVTEIDADGDPDSTTVLPSSMIESQDHHLAEGTPTTPLEPGSGDEPAASARRQDPAEDGPAEQDLGGLIPTTTTHTGQSNLSRRLEGL